MWAPPRDPNRFYINRLRRSTCIRSPSRADLAVLSLLSIDLIGFNASTREIYEIYVVDVRSMLEALWCLSLLSIDLIGFTAIAREIYEIYGIDVRSMVEAESCLGVSRRSQ